MTDRELLARYDQTRARMIAACATETVYAHVGTLCMVQQRFLSEDFLHSRCETLLGRHTSSQEK
jgi:hypothetical protein